MGEGVRRVGGGGVAGWGGGSLQTPIHMEKQLKNRQSNRETTPPPGRKRQKLKNQRGWGSGEKGWGGVRENSKVRWSGGSTR